MKKIVIIAAGLALIIIGGAWWSNTLAARDPSIISQSGIHWHPTLAIYVKGVPQEIPANIGVGPQYIGAPGYDSQMQMAAVHTHDDMPIIHLEFGGLVRNSDIMLGEFFKIWGKDMRSFGANMRMTVNGQVNTEYENLMMRDGDKIELRYE